MKKIIFSVLFLCSASMIFSQETPDSVDVIMMNLEIKNTLEEHERQKDMKNKQDANTVLEVHNKKKWDKLKEKVKKIQERLKFVEFALQGIPTGIVITRDLKKIKDTQKKIIHELQTAPYAILSVYDREIKFVEDTQMVLRFLLGIVTSYGIINQMEKAERKILLDYALEEVFKIKSDSYFTYSLIIQAKSRRSHLQGSFDYYINRDKKIVKDILKNFKKY